MANDYDYDYRRGRREREYDDEPYYRGQGGGYEESYQRGYGGEQQRYGRGGYEEPYQRGYGGEQQRYGRSGYYSEQYRRGSRGRQYGEPYGADYGRYEYGERTREPYYQRGYESESREPYYRGGYERGAGGRGLFERAGDEIKSWFGDEDAERRRRADEMRRGMYAGRGPRGYRRSDERIREDINDQLTEDWYVDASDIEVTVNNAMVTLTGRVESREEKRRAEDLAESVTGVKDVTNQLRVDRNIPITSESETAQPSRARSARS
jgi:osmotically-inducible protein OsmY